MKDLMIKETYTEPMKVFLEDGDGNIYRASFYTEGKDWRQYYTIIFNRIIQSFRIK